MKAFFIIIALFSTQNLFAASDIENFISLARKTSSVYSGSVQVDVYNSERIPFETLIDNQKVMFRMSVSKMNTSSYTVINSNSNFLKNKLIKSNILPSPPRVIPGNLNISADSNGLCSLNGIPALGTDTTCVGKKCTIKQLVISKCNETNCWKENSSMDRTFSFGIAEEFDLFEKVDISSCLTNNNEGVRHEITFSESEPLKGGTVNYQVIVINDVKE